MVTDVDAYLAGLNACFPNWGGRARFDWCFRRIVADREPDLLTIVEDSRTIAGSGVTYRRIRFDDKETRAAVITGSWTLPEARGRGLFSQMIDRSRETAAKKDAHLLLAFVTQENASCRRLRAAGARMIPTAYCRSTVRVTPATEERLPSANACTFVYTEEEWSGQFLERPASVERIESDRWSAVVEPTPVYDRVHHIEGERIEALTALTVRGRRVFAFATLPDDEAALVQHGFEIIRGYLAVFGDGPETWDIQNGDRM